jgi:hypothetical protein
MSSSRWGGTKLKNGAVVVVALSSNENHSSKELGEVIRTRCYCDRACLAATKCSNGRGDDINPLLLWYLCENMTSFTRLHKKILSTESSPPDPPSTCNRVPVGVCQQTHIASERRIEWSKKILDIFDWVILLWVYKMADMKYSRRGGTKVWLWLKWSSVATVTMSQSPIATVTLSSNGLGEVISTRCYYDQACLITTERSNGHGDDISSLLLWPSSTSHRKIYDINNKVS